MKIRSIVALAMVAALILSISFAAWAGEDLSDKEKKGIKTLAEVYFQCKQVTFYGPRVFIKDSAGYVLTFKVDQRKVEKDGIDGRPEYAGRAALFLINVSDYLQHPDRGPLGWGENIVIKKTGDQDKLSDREPSAGEELGCNLPEVK